MRGIGFAMWVLAGCYRANALAPCEDGSCDASPPSDGAGDPGCTTMGHSLVQVCVPPNVPDLVVGPFSTSVDANCDTVVTIDGGEVCVRWGANLTVTEEVKIDGTRPVVLVATGTFAMSNGLLDVSSNAAATLVGPGAFRDGCQTAAGMSSGTSGSGGGAGGSFGERGANGGNGNSVLGGAASSGPLAMFRAGCPGGHGGASPASNNGGRPGGGLFVIAGTSIMLSSSTINASGGGALGTSVHGGGGGGGSGGFIGLDAPTIQLDGASQLFALGGGGGPGGEIDLPGKPGDDPDGPTSPAEGLAGVTTCPGVGGSGSTRTSSPQPGQQTNGSGCGGGGGGGGHGIIGFAGGGTLSSSTSIAPAAVALP